MAVALWLAAWGHREAPGVGTETAVWVGALEEGIAMAVEGVGATEEETVEGACRGRGAVPIGMPWTMLGGAKHW